MTSEAWKVKLERTREAWNQDQIIRRMVWHEKRSELVETIVEYCEGQMAVLLPVDRTESLIRLMQQVNLNLQYCIDCFLVQDVFGLNTMDVELIKHPSGSGLLRFLDIRRHELDADSFMRSVSTENVGLDDWHVALDQARLADSRDLWRSNTRSVIRHFLTKNYGRHFAFLSESDARTLEHTWRDDFFNKGVSLKHGDPFQIDRLDGSLKGWSCGFRPGSWGSSAWPQNGIDYIDIEMYKIDQDVPDPWILYVYSIPWNRFDDGILSEYIGSMLSAQKY